MTDSIGVVIPVFNEEDAIGRLVAAIRQEVDTDVVVVDGGSTDRTVDLARAAGARVVVERCRGYGRACARGVTETTSDVLVFLDGDGSDDASQVGKIVAPILHGSADLVLGARRYTANGALPFYARAGNVVAAALITRLWGQHVTDLPSFKAIRRCDLAALTMTEETFGWTIEMIVKAAKRQLRILELPLAYYPRVAGVSKVSGNPRASFKAAIAILRVLARHGFKR